MNPAPRHNPTTDAMRARYQATIDARPAIPEHDRALATKLLQNARDQLREAFKLLRHRADLSDLVERAGLNAAAAAARLDSSHA